MEVLEPVLRSEVAADFEDVGEQGNLSAARRSGCLLAAGLFDGSEGFHDEHRVLGDDRPATFADECRVGDGLGITDFLHRVNDVPHVFVERVVHRAVEGCAGSIIVHAEASADIEVAEFVPHFGELRVEAGGFANGAFDGADVGNL